ncbi:MAG: M48 family metalloprotease [Nitrospina sp.]|jgi:predicted Zn-dependent protease|nr:M48 family metalloprotease [Nitrospina sp.]MBT6717319.1 M48 family metalloprotease [Nitrospina sp.]
MKKLFLLFFFIFWFAGCQSTGQKDCAGCAYDVFLWKTAVDTIALANFPEEEFNAVVHYAEFSNAWVTTGNEVNITSRFLHELSKEQRIAVAAHEIAHLKSGHYYTRLGASILTSIGFSVLNVFVPGAGYSEYLVKPALMGGFSRPQELEADKLGVSYLTKAGYSSKYYLQLLDVLRKNSGEKTEEANYFSTHPTNEERMNQIINLKQANE